MNELLLNVGSGQCRFDPPWINVDCISREGQVPDVIDDARTLARTKDGSAEMIVLQHVLEHFVLPEGNQVISACYRALKPGGSLIITLPDMKKLAQRWLAGMLDDYLFFVNAMGAYQGEDGDCHKWHYTPETLKQLLDGNGKWAIRAFDWRPIPGARVARDWWIQGWEAVKQ